MSRHHVLDVYDAHIHLATTPKQWRKLVRRFPGGLDGSECESVGSTSLLIDEEMSVPHLVVWLDVAAHKADALEFVMICAHEAAHVATLLLSHLGHRIQGVDEPHAYLVSWTTRWLLEQVDWPADAPSGRARRT